MSERPTGELRIRGKDEGVCVADVNFPKRLVDLIVAPYGEKTIVSQPYGRPVVESFERGAFSGIQRRPNRIKANRDHDVTRICGKCISLHPDRDEGLVATIKMFGTELGTETLILCDEGGLDGSAGFLPMENGEEWSRDRSEVCIRKAWLGHIALVPEPAYEGAKTLGTRSQGLLEASTAILTPNLDLVRAWRLEDMYALLDR